MNIDSSVLKNDEKAIFKLRELYRKYGYTQFKMSKFEEYDLYVKNKNFLVSDHIITFTDTDGKLMALKPDVTLSIIKNCSENEGIKKLYYNENVYRVSKGDRAFKEIMQVGLECIGNIDDYCIFEVILLAMESLNSISEECVLDISNLDIISKVMDKIGLSENGKSKVLKFIGEKNIHGMTEIFNEEKVDGEPLIKLTSAYGSLKSVLPVLNSLGIEEIKSETEKLEKIVTLVENNGFENKIRIDFSVINDMNYYNGFVFKGFVKGLSSGVLSGGEYNNLMQKMKKSDRAIGFAVYLDMLEFLVQAENPYDVDTLLLYDESADLSALKNAVDMLCANGKSVLAQKEIPSKIKYKQLLKLQERGVEIIENNA